MHARRVDPKAAPATRLARFEALLRSLPMPALLIAKARVHVANPAAQQLFGAQRHELIGQPVRSLFHPGAGPGTNTRIVRLDGQSRWVQASSSTLRAVEGEFDLTMLSDVTPLRSMHAQLQSSRAELQRLVAGQDAVERQSRRRLARELHDEIQQSLGAIAMEVGALAHALPADETLAPAVDRTRRIAQSAIESARRIADELQPLMLDELGLPAAIESLVIALRRRTGMQAGFRAVGVIDDGGALAWETTICLFRVAHAGLANVERHAHAKRVDVLLFRTADERLALRLRDDGAGFDPDAMLGPRSLGLLQMREQLRALGGALEIEGRRGHGTTLTATVPGSPQRAAVEAPAGTADADPPDTSESLIDFLYRVPVGLVQADLQGRIDMINPRAAQLLLPIAANPALDNLFDVLAQCVPQLRQWVEGVAQAAGTVCDNVNVSGSSAPPRIGLSVVKQRGNRLVAVLGPIGSPGA